MVRVETAQTSWTMQLLRLGNGVGHHGLACGNGSGHVATSSGRGVDGVFGRRQWGVIGGGCSEAERSQAQEGTRSTVLFQGWRPSGARRRP